MARTNGVSAIRPLNIAQVCPYDLDRPGGVQSHVRDTAAALGELGHQVTIIAPNVKANGRARIEGVDNVRVVRLGQAHGVSFSGTKFEVSIALGYQGRRLAALMRQGRFDVVHYHALWTPAITPSKCGNSIRLAVRMRDLLIAPVSESGGVSWKVTTFGLEEQANACSAIAGVHRAW